MKRQSTTGLLFLSLIYFTPTVAQPDIFSDPQNLQVLPEDTDSAVLRETMRGFAQGLGVRCHACHVGEEGLPLTEFDFASDDKELKAKARIMLRMVQAINEEHLDKLGQEHLTVACITCHRGVRKPQLTGEVLLIAYDDGGLGALEEKYAALRDQYYGTHSYDFSETVLSNTAATIAGNGNLQDAVAVLQMNLRYFPDSLVTYLGLGDIHAEMRNVSAAEGAYRRVMELNPQTAPQIEQRLNALRKSTNGT